MPFLALLRVSPFCRTEFHIHVDIAYVLEIYLLDIVNRYICPFRVLCVVTRGDDAMETKNICGKIPAELYAKVRDEIEEREINTQQFLQQVIEEHFIEKGMSSMAARTIAVQVTEDLFERFKATVVWKSRKQKAFLTANIEKAVAEIENEMQQQETAEEPEDDEEEPESNEETEESEEIEE